MNKTWLAGLALAALAGGTPAADEPSLCTRLADEVRQAPAAAWTRDDPMSAWIQPAPPASPSRTVKALATDARWRDQLGVPEDRPLPVHRLEGTPVYMVDEVAGTAACQSLVLLETQSGKPARQIRLPFDLDGQDMSLCATQSAFFARVLGQPAFVVGGAPSMTSPDLQYRIATWVDGAWARSCGITVRRMAVKTEAQRLAQAYEAARAANRPLDVTAFNGGHTLDAAVASALNPPLAEEGAVGNMNPPFPLFGADTSRLDLMLTVFSNAAPRVLAVQVEGRWWLAVVGRSGVGWREGDAVLVALFAPPGRAADGVASYQFLSRPSGLRDVTVTAEHR